MNSTVEQTCLGLNDVCSEPGCCMKRGCCQDKGEAKCDKNSNKCEPVDDSPGPSFNEPKDKGDGRENLKPWDHVAGEIGMNSTVEQTCLGLNDVCSEPGCCMKRGCCQDKGEAKCDYNGNKCELVHDSPGPSFNEPKDKGDVRENLKTRDHVAGEIGMNSMVEQTCLGLHDSCSKPGCCTRRGCCL